MSHPGARFSKAAPALLLALCVALGTDASGSVRPFAGSASHFPSTMNL